MKLHIILIISSVAACGGSIDRPDTDDGDAAASSSTASSSSSSSSGGHASSSASSASSGGAGGTGGQPVGGSGGAGGDGGAENPCTLLPDSCEPTHPVPAYDCPDGKDPGLPGCEYDEGLGLWCCDPENA